MMLHSLLTLVLAVGSLIGASAFSTSTSPLCTTRRASSKLAAVSTRNDRVVQRPRMSVSGPGEEERLPVSRRGILASLGGVVLSSLAFISTVEAKDDPNLKGTKADPEFVTCVSECVYLCTKSKEEARTRQDCIPECRKSCAKTKAQELVGAPRT